MVVNDGIQPFSRTKNLVISIKEFHVNLLKPTLN